MDEIPVSEAAAGLQQQPSVARFGSDGFVVAWADVTGAAIRGRVIGADGSFSSDEFEVSGPAPVDLRRRWPVVAPLATGFVVAWIDEALRPPGPRPQLSVQRFDSSAHPLGPPIPVNEEDVDTAHAPSVAMLTGGGFVVSWLGSRADRRVLARRYSVDGVALGAAVVASGEGFHVQPLVLRLDAGTHVVAWTHDPAAPGGGDLQMRRFDLQGQPVGDLLSPAVFGAQAMTLLDDARFVTAHVKRGPATDIGVETGSLRGEVFNPDGAPAGLPLFLSSQRGVQVSSPALAGLPGGRLAACWLSRSAETFATTTHLRAAVFSLQQGTLGAEIQVDADRPGQRFQTRVATTLDGAQGAAICFVWDDSDSGSGSGPTVSGIRARVLQTGPDGGFA